MAEPERRRSSPLAVFKAVAWSFLGIRRRSEYEADVTHLKPLHVIIAGIVAAIVFVLTLLVIVRIVISNAG